MTIQTNGIGTRWPDTPFITIVPAPNYARKTPEGLLPNKVVAQTFYVTNTAVLRRIDIVASGSGATNLVMRLYDLGVPANPTQLPPVFPVRMAARLAFESTFDYSNSTGEIVQFTFSGPDRIVLTSGHSYAFEISGNDSPNASGFNWIRSITNTYSLGDSYNTAGLGGTFFARVSGAGRDQFMAIYTTDASAIQTTAMPASGPAPLAVRFKSTTHDSTDTAVTNRNRVITSGAAQITPSKSGK